MRILVFSAHPDDAEFAMGGTLVQLAKLHYITLFVATSGGAGSFGSSSERKLEQEAAAEIIGAKLVWGGLDDCNVEYTRSQAFAIAQVIRDAKPDVIFAPHWDQQGGAHDGRAHPDHRALGLLVRDAARFARFSIPQLNGEKHDAKQLFYYMVPVHRKPKFTVPLKDVEGFRRLLAAHRSQLQLRGGSLEEYLLSIRRSQPGAYSESFDADEPLLISAERLL